MGRAIPIDQGQPSTGPSDSVPRAPWPDHKGKRGKKKKTALLLPKGKRRKDIDAAFSPLFSLCSFPLLTCLPPHTHKRKVRRKRKKHKGHSRSQSWRCCHHLKKRATKQDGGLSEAHFMHSLFFICIDKQGKKDTPVCSHCKSTIKKKLVKKRGHDKHTRARACLMPALMPTMQASRTWRQR